jgi:DNA-binding transcriptional regulator YdaS (Cro superfamily)
MNLKAYFKEQRGRQRELARSMRMAEAYLWQIANDKRPAAPELCVAIEQATDRAVRRWDLRPEDWHRIWPELIGADGAPVAPAAESQVAA